MDYDDVMLKTIGLKDKMDLFKDIPESLRIDIDLGPEIGEMELIKQFYEISKMNKKPEHFFLGNGIYRRYIPSLVDEIISRYEFLTSYTPYQPEISQGILQALFEYQSLICDLTGMDVTNSSMYDGFTALAEAVRMAYRINGRSEVLIPENLYKSKRSVINNYIHGLGIKLIEYKFNNGLIDLEDLNNKISNNTCAIIGEIPNSYGILDKNVFEIKDIKKDSILISYYDPVSLGIIKPPGEYDADIAVAEGQQLGIHMNYGGPLLGLFSFKKDYIHKSPGRLIGESNDVNGRRAFVMTLQAREQHIRRARATSNICSNQALLAIAASVYLSVNGASGLYNIAMKTIENSEKLRRFMKSIGIEPVFNQRSFSDNLFNVKIKDFDEKLKNNDIAGGIKYRDITGSGEDTWRFFSVTEMNDDNDFNALLKLGD
ncbi:aminomethyl-transferring glycine dehydrogenase subunit GcvPA [Picrophilus oshimae]|uniref:Glycine dehydrogenase (Decarboxylating) alpha subunit n=1 Tax=Picrophilus torridus (strain ATCC 700027 / DSM 9790 / JCM 10055 / NBRC 100828 / KAW 2/3) TaxID=1122961 RepID=A0A8G2FXK7_PICTO|nr:aminomethyl-transferring glycine dehydrogenase subunit GcvPA [Picrophilus oshimae]SMD31382.1 glycine dehydrogenase (decarboxylating) alpha subunit [Picrophilus oshimae DSM 9789]